MLTPSPGEQNTNKTRELQDKTDKTYQISVLLSI